MKASALIAAIVLGAVPLHAVHAHETYPNRSVRIVVPYSPGGLPDIVARILAQQFTEDLHQPFIVMNAPGGGGLLAINAVMEQPADGYTIDAIDPGQWAIAPAMKAKLPYDPERDFTPIGSVGNTAGVFIAVTEESGIKSLQDLIALAKAKPGTLTYGSAGVGSIHHMMMEDLKATMGLDILHVPYKSNNESVPALVAGDISVVVTALTSVQGFVDQGKIRLLAVGKNERSRSRPDVPTVAEVIGHPEFDHRGGQGFVVLRDTPPAIAQILSAELAKAEAMKAVQDRMLAAGLEAAPDPSPARMAKIIHDDRIKYGRLAKLIGLAASQ